MVQRENNSTQTADISGLFSNIRGLIDITQHKGEDGTIVPDPAYKDNSVVMTRGTGKEFLRTGWFLPGTFNGNYTLNLVHNIPWLTNDPNKRHKKVATLEIYRRDPETKEVIKKTQYHVNNMQNARITGSPVAYMEHSVGSLGSEFVGLNPRYEYQFIGKSELDEGAGREAYYDLLYIDPIPRQCIVKGSPEPGVLSEDADTTNEIATEPVAVMDWGWMEISTDGTGSGTGYVFPAIIDDDTWATNADHFSAYFNYIQSAHANYRVDDDTSCALNVHATFSASRKEYTLAIGVTGTSAASSVAWVYWTVQGYQYARQA